MTKEELYAHPGWADCTFEGARRQVLRLGLQTTFREKLEWLEEAEELSERLNARRVTYPTASTTAALNDAPTPPPTGSPKTP